MHMVPDRPGHTNAARWALSLESDRHIDRVTVQIGAIRDRIADVDPDPKPNSPVRKLVAIKDRNILLHLDRKAHCPIDTVEYHQQGVAAGLDNSTAVTVEGWIDDLAPEFTQPFERLQVIQADQAAVANHVRVDDRDKSPWIWKSTRHVRRSGHRHGGRLTGNAAGHNAIQKPPERHPSTGRPSADTWIGSPVWAHADLFDPGNRQCAVSRHQGLVIDALEGKQTMSKAAFLVPAWGAASVALLFVTLPGSTARGDEPKLSISGYDPVAYFTDGKPVPGKSDLEYQWHKLRWRFASSEHRDLFSKDPRAMRRNTTAIVRWARRWTRRRTRTPSIQRPGPSSTASCICSTRRLLAGAMAGTGQGVHKAGRRELAGHRGSAGTQPLSDHPALPPRPRPRSHCAMAATGWSSAARSRATRPGMSSGRVICGRRSNRSAKCRCVPQGRRRNRQQYCIYGQPCHGACGTRQIRRPASALLRPTLAGEHHRRHAATIGSRPAAGGRGHCGDQVSAGGLRGLSGPRTAAPRSREFYAVRQRPGTCHRCRQASG